MWKIFFYLAAVVITAYGAPSEEIFNGDDAEVNEWPWMVAIYRQSRYRCGGALIAGRYVLTSAHCVERAGPYVAILGEYDRNSTSGNEQEVDVTEVIVHPDYDYMTLDNDIALLKLGTKANLSNSNISKIKRLSNTTLDKLARQDSSVKCFVTGWGYETDDQGYWRLAPILQELEVDIIGNGRCDNFLLGQRNPSNICYKASDAGTCSGDSGSPLMCKLDSKWTLLGIHSFRINLDGCRGGAKAAARVSMYLSWIENYV